MYLLYIKGHLYILFVVNSIVIIIIIIIVVFREYMFNFIII